MAQHLISHFPFISARLFQVRSQAVSMVSFPPAMKMGVGVIFQGHWRFYLFIWTMGGLLHMGGVTIRDFPGGLKYQNLAQLTNAGPKSVNLNLTNCHRGVCSINFYQIVTSDVLTSLSEFDKI